MKVFFIRLVFTLVALPLWIASLASAGPVVVIRVDDKQVEIKLPFKASSAQGVVETGGKSGDKSTVIPLSEVAAIRFKNNLNTSKTSPDASGFLITLTDGQRVVRSTASIENDMLLGDGSDAIARIDIKRVDRLVRAGIKVNPPADRTSDTLILQNGDILRGLVAEVSDDRVRLVDDQNNEQAAPVSSMSAIFFALTPAGMSKEAPFTLVFENDAMVSADSLEMEMLENGASRASYAWSGDGEVRSIDAATLSAVFYESPGLLRLNMRTPAHAQSRGFIGESSAVSSRIRFIRMSAESIQSLPQLVDNAIIMRPQSVLTFAIAPGSSTFRSRLALRNLGPLGSAFARVKLDGKTAIEISDLVPGQDARLIEIPLAGAKELTLEIDFAEHYGMQSECVWIDPVLLK